MYFYFMCMSLPAHISVHRMHAALTETRRGSRVPWNPPEQTPAFFMVPIYTFYFLKTKMGFHCVALEVFCT